MYREWIMSKLKEFSSGFKRGFSEPVPEPNRTWVAVCAVAVVWIAHVVQRAPSPPTGAGFLYSVGWYAAEVFSALENLFR